MFNYVPNFVISVPTTETGDFGDIESSAAIGADGTIYFLAEGNRLYALYGDGTLKWFVPLEGHTEPDSSPSIGADGTIYVGSGSPYFYAVNPDGSIKWTFDTTNQVSSNHFTVICSSPAIDSNGVAYFGIAPSFDDNNGTEHQMSQTFEGILYAVSNGIQQWAYINTHGEIASSPLIGADGTIYVGARIDNNLGATNAATNGLLLAITNGVLKWSLQFPAEIVSSPVITANSNLIVGCEDGNLYSVPVSNRLATNQPWPMFHHDPQHTGCLTNVLSTPACEGPFLSDGKFDNSPPFQTRFSFTINGLASSTWHVYSSTNLLGLTNRPAAIASVTLDSGGNGSFSDTTIGSSNTMFYFLSNSTCASAPFGYISFNLSPSNSIMSNPFVEADDTNQLHLSEGFNQFSPMNSVGALFNNGTVNQMPDQTIITLSNTTQNVSNTNFVSASAWQPNGDIMLLPGAAVWVTNPSSSLTITFMGASRIAVTNQIPPATNCYLASSLPISGGISNVLGFPAAVGDIVRLWDTNAQAYVFYTNKSSGWSPTEPAVGLCQGFTLTTSTSHTWVQSFGP